jgi:hypothetical protein
VDKNLLKGLMMVVGAIVALGGLFVVASDSGPQKAECIANALKSGVAYGSIEKVCRLSGNAY